MRWSFDAPILSIWFVATGCFDGNRCEIADSMAFPAPGGESTAWVYSRTCSDSDELSIHVAIQPSDLDLSNARGNVFNSSVERTVLVEWSGPAAMSVRFDDSGGVYWADSQVGEVAVSFEALPHRPHKKRLETDESEL